MPNYLYIGGALLGAGLAALKFKKSKEHLITVNDFIRKDTHYEASITDGFGKTYRVYGENITWWYKTTNEAVPAPIAKALNDYRSEYMRKLIKASISDIPEDVVVKDGKQLKKRN